MIDLIIIIYECHDISTEEKKEKRKIIRNAQKQQNKKNEIHKDV